VKFIAFIEQLEGVRMPLNRHAPKAGKSIVGGYVRVAGTVPNWGSGEAENRILSERAQANFARKTSPLL
jgi:hypothetical protein